MAKKFEIVHKEDLNELKKSHKEAKSQLDLHEKSKIDLRIVDSLMNAIQEEGKRERDLIAKALKEIKDLNKSTLNNVIGKTDKLEMRLEDLVEVVGELSSNIGKIHEMHSDKPKDKDTSSKELTDIKKAIEKNSNNSSVENKLIDVDNKLNEVTDFMENLKVLLSQIRSPNDLNKLK